MRAVIAEDVETEKETALLESIESKIETKLTTMDNEKQHQDAIMMVADEIENLSTNVPELSNDTLAKLRTVALTYSDPIAEITVKANAKKKQIETDTEEKLLLIAESEAATRQQIAIDSLKMIEQVMTQRAADVSDITNKRNEQMISEVPAELKEKVKLFFNPVEETGTSQTTATQSDTSAGAI